MPYLLKVVNGIKIILHIGLSGIFVFSGITKFAYQTSDPTLLSIILSTIVGDDTKFTESAIAVLEILLGLMILSTYRLIGLIFAVLILFTSLMLGLSYFNEPISCGCFGSLTAPVIDEAYIIRNLILLIITIYLIRFSPTLITKEG